jgi:hypothetical protein
VRVGQFNNTWIEITAGLGQGDEILSPVDPKVDVAPDVAEKRG